MVMLGLNNLYNLDCMEGMREIPDKYFDLAIVDPPYFKGPDKRLFYGNKESSLGIKRVDYSPIGEWQVPGKEYFLELERVSKNQIIWGCNYYDYQFGSGRIVWDKINESSSFSDCELAYCSLHDSVRLYRYMWNGMLQGSTSDGTKMNGNKKLNEKRIHQCQKPIQLYKWLLSKYAKPGDKILDTHVGSASSLIACIDMGFEYLGFELDTNYFNAAQKRIQEYQSQLKIQFA